MIGYDILEVKFPNLEHFDEEITAMQRRLDNKVALVAAMRAASIDEAVAIQCEQALEAVHG